MPARRGPRPERARRFREARARRVARPPCLHVLASGALYAQRTQTKACAVIVRSPVPLYRATLPAVTATPA